MPKKRRLFFVSVFLFGLLFILVLLGRQGKQELKELTRQAFDAVRQASGPNGRVLGLKREGASLVISEFSGRGVVLWNFRASIDPVDWLRKPQRRSVRFEFDSLRIFAWTLARGKGKADLSGVSPAIELNGELFAADRSLGPLHAVSGLIMKGEPVLLHATIQNALFTLAYDSVRFHKNGTVRASGVTTVETSLLSPFPIPGEFGLTGRISLKGIWRFHENRAAGDFRLSSDNLFIGGVAVDGLSGRILLEPGRVDIPEFSGRAFGGKIRGRADGRSRPRDKSIWLMADLEDADLDRMPSKPQGISFSGKYRGRIEVSARGKSFKEVAEKLKER